MQLEAGRRIQVAVNGESVETGAATLAELLGELGYEEGAVATARNGYFVPRAARAATRLAAGDKLEIVSPRQGG
jgi:sulfur carrier protein